MPTARVRYTCQTCGYTSPKWLGRCPDCGEWNTFAEEVAPDGGTRLRAVAPPEVVSVAEIPGEAEPRAATGIGEFDRVLGGGIVPGSLVLIGGDPGIGKCVTGETRVLDPVSGSWVPITEWSRNARPVLSLDEESYGLIPRPVEIFHDRGVHSITEVKTRLGRTLRCTLDHPLLTPEGWRPVRALSPGARIAAPRALPYFGSDAMEEHEIKLIAYVLSDGSATTQTTVTTASPEVAADLVEVARRFGVTLRVYEKANSSAKQFRFVQPREQRSKARRSVAAALKSVQAETGLTWAAWARAADVNYWVLNAWRRAGCTPHEAQLQRLAAAADVPLDRLLPEARDRAARQSSVMRFLEAVGVRFARAGTKAVPECIFRLPRPQLALFLRVVFSCDGSIYVSRGKRPGVSYSTISKRLALDVQHLLLRFGLVAKLRTKSSRVKGRPYRAYELQLLGLPQVGRFLSEIGIWGWERARATIAGMPRPRMPSTHFDTVPTAARFWKHLQRVSGFASFKRLSAAAGVIIHTRREERPLARSTVAALATAYPSGYLQALGAGDVYWDEIRAITPAGRQRVYDLSVAGPSNYVANDLIIHNSTLTLQVSAQLAEQDRTVLYVSGEESARQTRMRAERLGTLPSGLLLLAENNLDVIVQALETHTPALAVIDSIQAVYRPDIPSAPGSVGQVRECTGSLLTVAKGRSISVLIVGHVTKEGQLAGPRVLEHLVDTVLYFEGDRHHAYRILRATKNRFGSTNEIGVFEMGAHGLVEVLNPSAVFLAERPEAAPGSAIVCALEGTRPLLLEIQALVTPTHFGMPRRTAAGIDYNRLVLLLAVLEKRAGLHLAMHDVYASVTGGLTVDDPAADLGVAVAVASAFRDRPVEQQVVVIGEVGLAGEVRAVRQAPQRVREATRLGFRRAVVPRATGGGEWPPDVEIVSVGTVAEALAALLG